MFEGQRSSINKSSATQTLATSLWKKKQKINEGWWSSQRESVKKNEDCKSSIWGPVKAKVRDQYMVICLLFF